MLGNSNYWPRFESTIVQETKQILTINNQLSFGGDLADTVLRLANINSFVAGDYVFYDQTFISIHDFGSIKNNRK